MSYCRNNGQDSDVYVFGSGIALECCGCSLYKNSYRCQSYSQMIAHLKEHKAKGAKVPPRTFTRLAQEQKEKKDKYSVPSQKFKNVRKTKNELLEQRFWKEIEPYKKNLLTDTLEVFESIYGRKPHRLEFEGIAKAVDISIDLHLTSMF
jgi:hypothetical protein